MNGVGCRVQSVGFRVGGLELSGDEEDLMSSDPVRYHLEVASRHTRPTVGLQDLPRTSTGSNLTPSLRKGYPLQYP